MLHCYSFRHFISLSSLFSLFRLLSVVVALLCPHCTWFVVPTLTALLFAQHCIMAYLDHGSSRRTRSRRLFACWRCQCLGCISRLCAAFSVWCVLQTPSEVLAMPLLWTRILPLLNSKKQGRISTGHVELNRLSEHEIKLK